MWRSLTGYSDPNPPLFITDFDKTFVYVELFNMWVQSQTKSVEFRCVTDTLLCLWSYIFISVVRFDSICFNLVKLTSNTKGTCSLSSGDVVFLIIKSCSSQIDIASFRNRIQSGLILIFIFLFLLYGRVCSRCTYFTPSGAPTDFSGAHVTRS